MSQTVVFDDTQGSVDGDGLLAGHVVAQSFSTQVGGASLSDVTLWLDDTGPTDTGSIVVSLRADAGGAPGASVATLGTIDVASLGPVDAPVDLVVAAGVTLSPATRYWVELDTTGGAQVSWGWTNDTSGPGVAGESFAVDGTVLPDSDGPMLMAVTTQTACFAAGTRIALVGGEVPVESLGIGDPVMALREGGPSPVKWIGMRRVDCSRHPRPADVWPIRIAPGAFGPDTPRRELELSPDHAVYLPDGTGFADGALIPVRYLVNGATIVQRPVDQISYFHVELERHDVLLAEGLPAESYLDTGNRGAFANGGAATMAHADFALETWKQQGCATLVRSGPRLIAVRERLRAVAQSLGHVTTREPDLHLVVDGVRLDGRRADATYSYRLPANARSVWLASRSSIPAETSDDATDLRRLGVAVSRIDVDGAPLRLTPGRGWHEHEPAWIWTDGAGSLAVEGARNVEVTLALIGRYWVLEPLYHAPARCGGAGLGRTAHAA